MNTSRTEKIFVYIYAVLSAIILFLACKTLTDTELFKYIMWSDRAIFRARLEPLEQFGAEIGRQFFPQRIPGPVYLWLTSVFFPEGQNIGRGWQIINILSISSVAGLAVAVARRFSLLAGLITLSALLGNLMMTSSLTRTYWNPSWLMISTCCLLIAALMMWRQQSRLLLIAGAVLSSMMIIIGTSAHLTFFIPATLVSLVIIIDSFLRHSGDERRSWIDVLIALIPLTMVVCIGIFWSVTLDFSTIRPSGGENEATLAENIIAISKLLADHANINFTDNFNNGNYLSGAKYFGLFVALNAPNYILLLLAVCMALIGSWQFFMRGRSEPENGHPVYLVAALALLVIFLISCLTFTAKPRYIYYLWTVLSVALAAGMTTWFHRSTAPRTFILAGYGLLIWASLANTYNHLLISGHYDWAQKQHTAALQTYRNATGLIGDIKAQGVTEPSDIRMGTGLFMDIGGTFEFIDSNQASALDALVGHKQTALSAPAMCLAVFISDKPVDPEIAVSRLDQQLRKHGAGSRSTGVKSSGNRLFATYPPFQGACLRTLANYYTDRYLFETLMAKSNATGPFRIEGVLPVELGISFEENVRDNKVTATITGDLNGYRGFMTPYAEQLVLEMTHQDSGTTTQLEFPKIIGLEGLLLPITSREFPRECGTWTATLKISGFGYVEAAEKTDLSFSDTVRLCE